MHLAKGLHWSGEEFAVAALGTRIAARLLRYRATQLGAFARKAVSYINRGRGRRRLLQHERQRQRVVLFTVRLQSAKHRHQKLMRVLLMSSSTLRIAAIKQLSSGCTWAYPAI